jgi:HPr kinase/phosphorylase
MQYKVKNLIEETNNKFNFTIYTGEVGFERIIHEPLAHRLSLAIVGHYKLFPEKRIQVCGVTEYSYLEGLSLEERRRRIEDIVTKFGNSIPVIIFTAGLKPFPELVELCKKFSIAVLGTNYETVLFINDLAVFLEDKLAKSISLQGVMVNVYGVGIVICGDSGIGKSETAIELLKRGHMFVADDIVKTYISSSGILMGTSENVIKDFIEVRGLGIIDVSAIFGIGAILDRSKIDLIVRLKLFSSVGEYDRLGEKRNFVEIYGVKVPEIVIPVGAGRNVATLIEIAALNFKLQEKGYFAIDKLNSRVFDAMKMKEKTNDENAK